uniref:Predicted GPI-anchored protein 58 n=1 Tax=Tursiops truncatus TaxID=9739 RepID=A0A6J3QAB0_TURTR|nr:predicted GPI-anchored protein 58 [Tursiops truncatus]
MAPAALPRAGPRGTGSERSWRGGGRAQASARALSRPDRGASSLTEPAAAAAAAEAATLLPRRQSQSSSARAEQGPPIEDQLGDESAGPQGFAGCRESGRAARPSFARAPSGPAQPAQRTPPPVPSPPVPLLRAVAPAESPGTPSPAAFAVSRNPSIFPAVDGCLEIRFPIPLNRPLS